jgi:adenylate cyclase
MPLLLSNRLSYGNYARWLRRHRVLVVTAVTAAIIAVTQLPPAARLIPLLKLEQASIDFRFRLRGYVKPSPECAIVGINASSFDPSSFLPADLAGSEALRLMQEPFPWNRKVYAMLLDKLFAAGARTVVLDLLFLNGSEGDDDLADALQKYGNRIVIGSAFVLENPESSDTRQIYRLPAPALLAATKENITGCVSLPVELDEVIRRTWYWTSELRQYGVSDDSRDITSMAGLGAVKFHPELDLPDGSHYINFQGPATTYPYLPIEGVFMDRMFNGSRQFEFGNVFKNKLVFVGPVAELFHDSHNTPYGMMPGVEIHTQIASSLLQGTPLRNAPGWIGPFLCFLMALLAAWVSLKITHALALSGILGAGLLLFAAAAQWSFVGGGMLIPVAVPMVVFAGTGLFGLVFNFLLEQAERIRIRAVLDQYVSGNVAELVLKESDQFEQALRGQKRSVTALFSDIREFTTITEGAAPEDLIEQLNEYFYKMVDVVLAAEGTLQQFIGDAIMAVWGNTYTVEPAQGARQAVRAAMAMQAALKELNLTWGANPARRKLSFGIGVNHGEVIVGTIGHPKRMEFIAIGDGINTAARLEAATKQFGCIILVGEAVQHLTRERFHYRQVGQVQFKGKMKTIEVYTPLGDASSLCPRWLDDYHLAIGLYRKRAFERAAAAFEEVRGQIGGEDRLCEMYIERCEAHMADAPPPAWEGSWTLTEK